MDRRNFLTALIGAAAGLALAGAEATAMPIQPAPEAAPAPQQPATAPESEADTARIEPIRWRRRYYVRPRRRVFVRRYYYVRPRRRYYWRPRRRWLF